MEIIIDSQRGMVEIWAPKGTPESDINVAYSKYRDCFSGRSVVIYKSGHDDLVQATQELIFNNN